MDLRNTDKMRLTSLAWAALENNVEVFEWLLLDYGHDDQELSRVSYICACSNSYQDAEHNTIFHLLAAATAPLAVSPHAHLLMSSPDFPPRPPSKTPSELVHACHRMAEVYYTLFPFLVDWSNTSGKTALHVAAQANNSDIVNQLCDLGADVSLADLQGNTPLHYASAWGHTECIRSLLERGAQVGLRNFEGFTAADFAYSHHVRTALDAIAREVLEERRARKREERAMQKERERAEREAYERASAGALSARESAVDERSEGSRFRSGSGSTAASGVSAHSSSLSTPARREPEPQPPLPPLPPSVAMAAAAAALVRNERRAAERAGPYAGGSYSTSRSGSPTPIANRIASQTVPTLMLNRAQGTPTPGNFQGPNMGSPTPRRNGAFQSPPSSGGVSPTNTSVSMMHRQSSQQSHAL
jgi:hypothetical protein